MDNFPLKIISYLKSGLGNTQVLPPNIQKEALAGNSADPRFSIEGIFVSLFSVHRIQVLVHLGILSNVSQEAGAQTRDIREPSINSCGEGYNSGSTEFRPQFMHFDFLS